MKKYFLLIMVFCMTGVANAQFVMDYSGYWNDVQAGQNYIQQQTSNYWNSAQAQEDLRKIETDMNGGNTSYSARNNNSIRNSSVSHNRSKVSQRSQRKWRDCSLCHGKGTIIRDSSVPTYGNDSKVYCSQCGCYYWASSGHTHITCPTCHGKRGFWSD